MTGPKSSTNGSYDTMPNPGLGYDSSSYYFETNGQHDINGTVLTETITNLQHSYYYDTNGNKHNISKMVRTFSDMSKNPSHANDDPNHNMLLIVNADPTDGFWYDGSAGITVTDQYYDENGNLINFNNDTAYIAVTSLNAFYCTSDPQHKDWALNGTPWHVENASLLSNGKAIGLLGSSITAHGNTLYSDNTNEEATVDNSLPLVDTVWKNTSVDWDKKGPNEYFGAGLLAVSGDSSSIRFFLNSNDVNTHSNGTVWATTTTIIPSTPGPTRKTLSVHYHNNSTKAQISSKTKKK